ncbi:MAG TPA: glycine--tRNA ligase subunit beta [Arenimonas sp.]|nr:glycine--tRNA ligase subunit beta [Arenimonas sp.]HPW31423.1 glycine--tRNA ligase subunit beta [Arenimonas sp.]
MSMLPLLIELGTEELPPKALPELAQAFFDGIANGFEKRGIAFNKNNAKALYSPRRLAALFAEVGTEQASQKSEVLGPYLNIGLNAEGQPTPALLGFASKNGLSVEQLEKTTDQKGERFVARSEKPGAITSTLIAEIVSESLAALPIPKPMRWGSRETKFIRPVHWLVMLMGNDVIDGEVMGLKSDRMSRGHRFHHNKPVWISSPHHYVDALRDAFVLVNADERRDRIREQIETTAKQTGGSARIDENLLNEVNCLVEWPSPVLCSFEKEFLAVPQEALITTMESNQKFFPVLDANGKLSEQFIGIANIESKDVEQVRKGYERVIRPRFSDAKFFYDEDLKQGLSSMAEGLTTVTYQQKLGTYADKTNRIAALAEAIAKEVGADPVQARRAAELCKADLQSRMVGEFPELQGIAGRYYAKAAGEPEAVANAIDEAYQPRFAGDAIAPSKLGQVLAIAERLDTLAGGFAAGLKPTGNKDAFALRRNALGLARTLLEANFEVSLSGLLEDAIRLQPIKSANDDNGLEIQEQFDFVIERLRNYFNELGFTNAQFDAVNAIEHVSLPDFDKRLKAVREFAQLPEAPALAAANKRIRNILRKVEGNIPDNVNPDLLQEQGEKDLYAAISSALSDTDTALASRDYVAVLSRLATLRPQVDAFFDSVMVNVDAAAVRDNRLALLKTVADRFASVAEIAALVV